MIAALIRLLSFLLLSLVFRLLWWAIRLPLRLLFWLFGWAVRLLWLVVSALVTLLAATVPVLLMLLTSSLVRIALVTLIIGGGVAWWNLESWQWELQANLRGLPDIGGPITDLVGLETDSSAIEYFALGDSVASGHGLKDDWKPEENLSEQCRRSDRAYPYHVQRMLKQQFEQVHLHHLACSGASARPNSHALAAGPADEKRFKWLHNQVQEVVIDVRDIPRDRPVLVSITIGANDFGWTNPVNYLERMGDPGADYYEWVNETSTAVADELKRDVRTLLQFSNVKVIITQYHNPFNHNSHFFWLVNLDIGSSCGDYEYIVGSSINCAERMEAAVRALNDAFVQQVQVPLVGHTWNRLRVVFGLHESFQGQESPSPSCGTYSEGPSEAETWVQYPGDPDSNSWIPSITRKPLISLRGIPDEAGDCFHPNEQGARVYAEAVNKEAAKLNE